MRNLHLLYSVVIPELKDLQECLLLCVDCDDSETIYCAVKNSVVALDTVNKKIKNSVSLVDEGFLSPDGSSKIIGLQHLPESMSVCAATSCGNLVLWSPHSNQVECVGTFGDGIAAMEWSPDLELVVIITGSGTLMLMTRDYDSLIETTVHVEGFGEAKPITVGWGKKETQFHGSEGKSAATKVTEAVKSDLSKDDNKPRISWRDDGQFFAVSIISQTAGLRQIRVWSREGELHSTSENTLDLGPSLSYKPSGSLIATSSKKIGKLWVALLEKNGLQHGEFELPFSVEDTKVVEVLWNSESTVLAVWCENLSTSQSYIQLWTVNNYHWYLKQSLEFSAHKEVRAVRWDTAQAYRLHVVCGDGAYLQYNWSWATDKSCAATAEDFVSVAVIDGCKVLVTPFRHMSIPPPMAALELKHSHNVVTAVFGTGCTSNSIMSLLTDGSLCIFRPQSGSSPDSTNNTETASVKVLTAAGGNGFTVKCPLLEFFTCLRPDEAKSKTAHSDLLVVPLNIQHLLWLSDTTIVFISLVKDNDKICPALVTASLDISAGKYYIRNWNLMCYNKNIHSSIKLDEEVLAVAHNQESESVAVEMRSGQLFKYQTGTLEPWLGEDGLPLRFPQPCPQISVASIGGVEVLIGLTDRHRLYINNTEISNNCTSYALHNEFLLLTTHSHTLRCIYRKTSLKDLPNLSTSKSHVFDESIRSVERGSRLVSVVPDGTKVVLQMPRGNLETIHPRALVIYTAQQLLNRLEYSEAFTLMKRHRIDMNLLYDHDSASFLHNTTRFVNQLNSATNLNLFLSSLQESDVTRTMYTATYVRSDTDDNNKNCNNIDKNNNKLDTVCDAVRTALENIDKNKYILSIITTYVKKKTPELQNALQCIRAAKADQSGSSVSADEALVYLLYHIDVNELYNVALGTYDFDLVLMVAEKSTKDPKEYLSDLNSLRSMEPDYQRYTIDMRLRRFESALENIVKCGSEKFEECLKLIKDQKLYSRSLKLFPRDSKEYKEISSVYGEYLTESKLYEEAGLVYMRAGLDDSALQAYEQALDWRQALCAAARLQLNPTETTDLCRRLAARLKDTERHLEGACLLEQYCQHHEEAIAMLISGHQWSEALRLISKYSRQDLVETDLRPALVESSDRLLTLIQNKQQEFITQRDRLQVVRLKKATEMNLYDGLGGGDVYRGGDSDIFSDSSSVVSGAESSKGSTYSRSSGHSGKSRKKVSKKRWSLREGSVYEDLALVEALYKTVSLVDSLKDDVGSTLRVLVEFGYEDLAGRLQDCMSEALVVLETSLTMIWTEELRESKSSQSKQLSLGPESTASSIAEAYRQKDRKSQNSSNERKTTEPQLEDVLLVAPVLNKTTRWKLSLL